MVELNDIMKDCLIEANNEYPDLDYVDTVIQAFAKYVNMVGAPVAIESDEEGEELMYKAVTFLVDCVLFNLVAKGAIEVDSLEDGEFVYKAVVEF